MFGLIKKVLVSQAGFSLAHSCRPGSVCKSLHSMSSLHLSNMSRHAPSRWWRLLSIVVCTHLSVTTCVHLENLSEAEARNPESLLAHGSADLARSSHGDHSFAINPESIIEQSHEADKLSSAGVAKDDMEVNKHVVVGLSGVEGSYTGKLSPKVQSGNSELHESLPFLAAEQEDIDTFMESFMKFEKDYIPSNYARVGEEHQRTFVVDLKNHYQEITRILRQRLPVRNHDQKITAINNEIAKAPSAEEEPYTQYALRHNAWTDYVLSGKVPDETYSSIVGTKLKLESIVEDLKDWLHLYGFPKISDVEFHAKKAEEEAEPVVKMIFQAIEYMHKYSLISPYQMKKFFDLEISQIAGNHLASIQLFGVGQDLWHFTPTIEEFRDDWRTYHLHKCLNDLSESTKCTIIQSAIGTYLKAMEKKLLPGKDINLEYLAIEGLFTKYKPTIKMDDWENLIRFFSDVFERKSHPNQGGLLEFKFKINFYMLDFVLRYNPMEYLLFEKSGINREFLQKFIKVKMSHRDFNLKRLASECESHAWDYKTLILQNNFFTQNQWIEKAHALKSTSKEIRKVIDNPSKEILENPKILGWLASLPKIKEEVEAQILEPNLQAKTKIIEGSWGKMWMNFKSFLKIPNLT